MATTTHPFIEYIDTATGGGIQPSGVDHDGNIIAWQSQQHTVAKFDTNGNPVNFSALGSTEIDGKGTLTAPPRRAIATRNPTNGFMQATGQEGNEVYRAVAIDDSAAPPTVTYMWRERIAQGEAKGEVDVFDSTGDSSARSIRVRVPRRPRERILDRLGRPGRRPLHRSLVVRGRVPRRSYVPVDKNPAISGPDPHRLRRDGGDCRGPELRLHLRLRRAATSNTRSVPALREVSPGRVPPPGPRKQVGLDVFRGRPGRSACTATRGRDADAGCRFSMSTPSTNTSTSAAAPRALPSSTPKTIRSDRGSGSDVSEATAGRRHATSGTSRQSRSIAPEARTTAGSTSTARRRANRRLRPAGDDSRHRKRQRRPSAQHRTPLGADRPRRGPGRDLVRDRIWDRAHTLGIQSSTPCTPATPYAADQNVSADLSGLVVEGEYHWRIVVKHERPKLTPDEVFKTHAVLGVAHPATNLTNSSADLNGSLNPDGMDTHYRFEYGITSTTTTRHPWSMRVKAAASSPSLPSGSPACRPAGSTTSGSWPATPWARREARMKPSSCLPVRRSRKVASGLTNTSADLNARIDGLTYDTTYHFDYGPTPNYGLAHRKPTWGLK